VKGDKTRGSEFWLTKIAIQNSNEGIFGEDAVDEISQRCGSERRGRCGGRGRRQMRRYRKEKVLTYLPTPLAPSNTALGQVFIDLQTRSPAMTQSVGRCWESNPS
jgi:hypothetical protein